MLVVSGLPGGLFSFIEVEVKPFPRATSTIHCIPTEQHYNYSILCKTKLQLITAALHRTVYVRIGEITTDAEADETVICDTCGGEYHFRCVGLELLPRLSYKCLDCVEEQAWDEKKDFELINAHRVRLRGG